MSRYGQSGNGLAGLNRVDSAANVEIYLRPNVLPYARLVYQFEVIPERAAQYARLNEQNFDPTQIVLLDSEPDCTIPKTKADLSAATIVERNGGKIDLMVQSDQAGLLVLSEAFFPGWQAEIDGQRYAIQPAYTAVQAVCVPAGEHLVKFRFRPFIFLWGGIATLIGLFIAGWIWRKG